MEKKVVFVEGQEEKARELVKALGVEWTVGEVEDPYNDFLSRLMANLYKFPGLRKVVDDFQERSGALVYYVTHDYMPFGECYSFLYVSKYPEDWPYQTVRKGSNGEMCVMAYVWNVSAEHCSEYGSIVVINERGILRRVG